MKEAYIVFECAGDLSKNLIATSVVSSIKKAHPERKIVVVTHFPEAWLHNPHVYRLYPYGRLSYFYDDFIKDKDTLIFRHDPLGAEDFIYGRKSIVEAWCDMCKAQYDGSVPSLYFTWREKEAVGKLTTSNKPLFFIQTNVFPLAPTIPEFWATDIPLSVAQEVVDRMNSKGFRTVHLRAANQPALKNADPLSLDSRQILCAIQYSKARLFINSYALHAAKAHGLNSVVLWIASNPSVSGYKTDANIACNPTPELEKYIHSYKEGYDIGGALAVFPHDREKIFNVEEIVEALTKDIS